MTDHHFCDKSISQLKTIVREQLSLDVKKLRSFGDLRKRETWEKIIEQHLRSEVDCSCDQVDWIEATAEDCYNDQRIATCKGWDISVYLPNGGIVAVSVHKDGLYWQASTDHLKAWMDIGRHVKLAKRFLNSDFRVSPKESSTQAESSHTPISFGKTVAQLFSGDKTVTRRLWQDSCAHGFIKRYWDGVTAYPVFDKDHRYGGKQVGMIELLCPPYQERLMDMPDSDLAREGFPELSRTEFIDQFFEGNPKLTVWVVRFKFVPLTAASEQVKLITG